MRVTSGKSRVRESRPPGSVRAKPNGRATRPRPQRGDLLDLYGSFHQAMDQARAFLAVPS